MTNNEIAVPEAAPVATRNGNTPAAVAVQQPANMTTESALEAWARDAIAISQIASNIATTTLAGAYRGKPDEVTAVILAGHELGIQPMTSLKSIDVIQGQPALRAHAMRGILQSQGHEIELVESDARHCVMRGRRKGADAWQEVVWDIPRAQQLGLMGKDQWKKQPKSMLIARATGEICRLVASDALHGMPYAAEELDARPNITVEQVTARPLSVAAITAQAGAPAPASEYVDPEADDAEHAAAVAELDAFGAEYEAPDIRGDAFRDLGLPVEDAPAQAIRDLVTKWRTAAA